MKYKLLSKDTLKSSQTINIDGFLNFIYKFFFVVRIEDVFTKVFISFVLTKKELEHLKNKINDFISQRKLKMKDYQNFITSIDKSLTTYKVDKRRQSIMYISKSVKLWCFEFRKIYIYIYNFSIIINK